MMVFGQDGGIPIGCGIMVLDTAVSALGDMDTTTIGQDLSLFMAACMTRSILFGDIIIPIIMDTDMDMDIHTDIIHGGDLTTLGIILTPIMEISIQILPLSVAEEVQETLFRQEMIIFPIPILEIDLTDQALPA